MWFCCRAHFEAGGYFGLSAGQVHFFQQGFLPCLTEEGKVIMESSSRVRGGQGRGGRGGGRGLVVGEGRLREGGGGQ